MMSHKKTVVHAIEVSHVASFGEIVDLTAVRESFILTSLCLMMPLITGEPPTTQNIRFTKSCSILQNRQVEQW